MNRRDSASLILVIIVLILMAGIGIWWMTRQSTPTPAPSLAPSSQINHTGTSWLSYQNTRHGYNFSYPPAYTLGSDIGGDPTQSGVVYLAPLNQDPLFICAADNTNHWSSADILNGWAKNTPSDFGKCMASNAGGTPSYIQSASSSPAIAGITAYEVTNVTSNRYEAICDYLATSKTILGICLPPDNRAALWQQGLTIYRKILTSLHVD